MHAPPAVKRISITIISRVNIARACKYDCVNCVPASIGNLWLKLALARETGPMCMRHDLLRKPTKGMRPAGGCFRLGHILPQLQGLVH